MNKFMHNKRTKSFFSRNLNFALIILFFAILSNNYVFADGEMVTRVDTTIATIGDHINLTIDIQHDKTQQVKFPDSDEFGKFQVLDRSTTQKELKNLLQSQAHYKISTFDTGQVKIPPLAVKVTSNTDSSQALVYKSDSISINVISVLSPNASQEKDIKGPFSIRTIIPWETIIFAALFILFSLGLYLSIRQWRKKNNKTPKVEEDYLKPPHTVAFQRLKKLREKTNFSDKKSLKIFFFKLSEIVRQYLERRFFIYALEMSTSEIIESSDYFDLDQDMIDELHEILRAIDIYKYANQPSDRSTALQYWQNIHDWIKETKHDPFYSDRSGLTETIEEMQAKQN